MRRIQAVVVEGTAVRRRRHEERLTFRDVVWVDGDLSRREAAAVAAMKQRVDLAPDPDPAKLEKVDELLRDVAKTEFERETNLNSRATAVAAVAGLIVTASGAIAQSLFRPAGWSDDMKLAIVVLFLSGLVSLGAGMAIAVVAVLKPKQAPMRRVFFTDTVLSLWIERGRTEILAANADRLQLLYVDRLLRTITWWSVRNRSKARWLRRAWMFLAGGIVLVGVAGVLVLAERLDYSVARVFLIIGIALALVWLVLRLDLIRASRKRVEVEREEKEEKAEVNVIAEQLRDTPPG
jgi:hypothetical protein